MDNELRQLHYQVEGAPYSKEKMDMCRRGWEIADRLGDYEEQYFFRDRYIHDMTFYDDAMEMYVVFPVMLKKHDEYVKEHGFDGHTKSILWTYKWVLENANFFYQITQAQFLKFFEDFKRRCMENGFSLRPCYQYGYRFFAKIDREKAEHYYGEFVKQKRDRLSDCHACERNEEISYLLLTNQYEKALELAQDIFRGKLTCLEVPDTTYGRFLRYYNQEILSGRIQMNEEIIKLREQLRYSIRYKKLCLEYIGAMLLNYSITDKGKALTWFKWYCGYVESMRNPEYILYFAIGAMHFFGQMRNKKSYRIKLTPSFSQYREDGCYCPQELYNYYYSIAYEIATKMDDRNGSSYYMDYVKLVEKAL